MNRSPPLAPALLALLAALAGCASDESLRPSGIPLEPLPDVAGNAGVAAPRVSGPIGRLSNQPQPIADLAAPGSATVTPLRPGDGQSPVSLEFRDTDIREVSTQILGGLLGLNHTIDPGVRGTATFRTARPLPRNQLIPTLQALLGQNGATLVQIGGMWRVMQAGAGGAAGGQGQEIGLSAVVVQLRHTGAEELARLMQPLATGGSRVIADPTRNAVVISGDAAARDALQGLVASLDTDALAGQSYALLPVASGGAREFAQSMQEAFRAQAGGPLAETVRFIPLARMNAVLAVSGNPRAIEQARRVYGLVDRGRRQSVRDWHVHYLQHSTANNIAHLLQQAFTPWNVTARPSTQQGPTLRGMGGGMTGLTGQGGAGAGSGGAGLRGSSGASGGTGAAGANAAGGARSTNPSGPLAGGSGAAAMVPGNPLLEGLTGGAEGLAGGEAAQRDADSMRIIPDPQNNSVLVFATPAERDTVRSMINRIDIMPLQVRIDAVIAEVTLNDQLRYGTQFFLRSGDLNVALGDAANLFTNLAAGNAAGAGANALSGFVVGTSGNNGVVALSALQNITTVNVLSSPQIMVMDNQTARLRVGDLVPFLTQSAQSTVTAGSPVINQIDYRPTGVILDVTPRVNSGGLVTLDIVQEVSEVNSAAPRTDGIQSPTFSERSFASRVVVQDGQTLGLAGLIRDNRAVGNTGLPWLKDIPILGLIAGTQDNRRARTELLVLITPRVVQDQRGVRALADDLREQLPNAARVPQLARDTRTSGRPDPGAEVRRRLGLERR